MRVVLGESARWGDLEHLIATLVDQVGWLTHLYASVHSKRRPRPPRPIRRPGVELDAPGVKRYRGRPVPLDRLAQLRERWRKGKG